MVFIVEEGELIKIRYNSNKSLLEFLDEAMEAFIEVTKLVEPTNFLFHFISYVG